MNLSMGFWKKMKMLVPMKHVAFILVLTAAMLAIAFFDSAEDIKITIESEDVTIKASGYTMNIPYEMKQTGFFLLLGGICCPLLLFFNICYLYDVRHSLQLHRYYNDCKDLKNQTHHDCDYVPLQEYDKCFSHRDFVSVCLPSQQSF